MGRLSKYQFIIIISCALISANSWAKDYYLAVKGGVSLGSYEAGYNWNFVNDIRGDDNKELKVVSGASAGAINAIASVIQMCSSEATTMKDNLFFQIWNMDIEELLPEKKKEKTSREKTSNYYEDSEEFNFGIPAIKKKEKPESSGDSVKARANSPYYNEKGGVFTRRAFDEVISRLKVAAGRDNFIEPCNISFTLSVTKFNPSLVDLHDGLAPMKVARHVIPLKASVENGRLYFSNEYTNNKDDRWYQKIYLPTAANGHVPFHNIIKSALSSSAYPVAFSPIELSYCVNEVACDKGDYKHARFSDGGLFDNAPVGAATERLLFSGEGFDSKPDLNVSVHYLDPSMTRGVDAKVVQEKKKPKSDIALGSYMDYLFSAMDVGMSQELYRARQMLKIKDIRIHSSTRRYPLASSFHANFSGFYSEDFRVHDYLVGVYDAVFDQAMLSGDASGDSRSTLGQRVKKQMEEITSTTCCNGGRDHDLATQFLWFLYEDEFSIDEFEVNYLKNPYVLLSVALRDGWDVSHGYQHDIIEISNFNKFIDNLSEMVGADIAGKLYHASTVDLMKDRTDWMGGVANRAYDNLINLQSESNSDDLVDKAITEILQVSQAVVQPYIFRQRSGYWPKGTFFGADDALSVYYGFDLSESAQLLNLQGIRFTTSKESGSWLNNLTFELPATYHHLNRNNESDHYVSITPTFKYHRDDAVFSTIELGYDYSFAGDVYDEPSTGVVLGVGLIAELLQVKVVERLEDINGTYSPNSIRSKTRLMMTIDAGRVLEMIF